MAVSGNRDSIASIESTGSSSSSVASPRHVLSPTLKPIVTYFDAPPDSKPPLARFEGDEEEVEGVSENRQPQG